MIKLTFKFNNIKLLKVYIKNGHRCVDILGPHSLTHPPILFYPSIQEQARTSSTFYQQQNIKLQNKLNYIKMAALAHQIAGACLTCPSLSNTRLSRKTWKNNKHSQNAWVVKAAVTAPGVGVPTAETRERARLKEMFEDAYERCRTAPMEGVAFNVEDFHTAIQEYDFNSEIGTKV